MAKSKGKKSVSTGVPKKVAGVKVPKAVRESKSLGTLLTSGLGREILADALIAAAAAAAAALTKTRPVQNAGHAVADAGANAATGTTDLVQTAAGAVAGVVTEAAKTFLPAALVGESSSGTSRAAAKSSGQSSRKRSKKTENGEKSEGKKRSRKKAE